MVLLQERLLPDRSKFFLVGVLYQLPDRSKFFLVGVLYQLPDRSKFFLMEVPCQRSGIRFRRFSLLVHSILFHSVPFQVLNYAFFNRDLENVKVLFLWLHFVLITFWFLLVDVFIQSTFRFSSCVWKTCQILSTLTRRLEIWIVSLFEPNIVLKCKIDKTLFNTNTFFGKQYIQSIK